MRCAYVTRLCQGAHVLLYEEEAYRREVNSVPRYLAIVKHNHPVMASIKSCHLGS